MGVDPNGGAYFTMKRVQGATLAEILAGLRKGNADLVDRFTHHKLLSAFSSVCLAVDYAHSRGVVHRDLKPANIMLGDFGEVYLLDWGLAKLTRVAEPAATPVSEASTGVLETGRLQTGVGQILGTPGYIAPEMLAGQPVDHRADVYALGAILFEILAQEPLHRRGAVLQTLGSNMMKPDARPSVRAPHLSVPPELDEACVTATALAPCDRFSTARALQEAVESYLAGDRDLALRRGMAQHHAERAEAAATQISMAKAESRDGMAHGQAMRDVGRALALDPHNAGALTTMVRLMGHPPAELPPRAEREFEEDVERQTRVGHRAGVMAYGSLLALFPFYLWMGVRSVGTWLIALGCLALATVGCWVASQRKTHSLPLSLGVLVSSTVGFIVMSRSFGAFVLVPFLVIANTLAWAASPDRTPRWLKLLVGCVGVGIPITAEWTGFLPPSYVFVNGTVTLLPHMNGLSRTPTLVFLTVATLSVIAFAFQYVTRIRAALFRAERRLFVQAWQLRQLVGGGSEGNDIATSPRLPAIMDGT
jgi:serine/threonine-protein kinase